MDNIEIFILKFRMYFFVEINCIKLIVIGIVKLGILLWER